MKKLKQIIKNLNFKNLKKTDSATVQYYVQITGKYGVKFFISKRKCEGCFFRQQAAFKMGFGPKPLFTGIKNRYYYYVTEHALLGDLSNSEMAALRKKVSSMAWATYDLYSDNVGKVKNKPVLIDFDLCTLG